MTGESNGEGSTKVLLPAFGICVAALTTCTPGAHRAEGAQPVGSGQVTRSGVECEGVIARAIAMADSGVRFAPIPENVELVFPIPDGLRGRTVKLQFIVDTAGVVEGSSVRFSGAGVEQWSVIRNLVSRWHYRPAVLDGCAVPAPVEATISF